MALTVIPITDISFAEELEEFGKILEGVEAEILSIPNDTTPSADTTDTIQTEYFVPDRIR